MKRLYDWITKANQVLLFFAIIALIVFITFVFFDRRRTYEPPHVAVAQTAEEAKESVVHDVEFLGVSGGIYVLGIEKRVVIPTNASWTRPSGHLGSGDDNAGQTVNVVFSKGEERIRTLLPKDGLVLNHNMYDERQNKPKALLFSCVTEDTDGNRRLDVNDRNDLYIVSLSLDRPDLVLKGVSHYHIISPTHLAVKTVENNVIHFWDIDVETQAKKEIAWK